MDNVIITSHIASASPQAVDSCAAAAATSSPCACRGEEAAQRRQRREGVETDIMEDTATYRRPFPLPILEQFCRDGALRQCGLSEADARVTADVLVTTDTFGVFTHGIEGAARATSGGCGPEG